MRRLVRTLLPLAAATALVGLGGVTSPASAVDSTPSCTNGVMSGADSDLQKGLVSVTPGSTAGDYTVVYSVTSPTRPAGTYRLRDCVFVNDSSPGYNNETLIGNSDEKDAVFVANNGGGSTTTITQQLTGIGAGEEVCDRAAMSGTDGGTSFTDKSNLFCFTPDNPPVVPESALAVTLPLAAVGAVALVLFLQHRRRAAAEV